MEWATNLFQFFDEFPPLIEDHIEEAEFNDLVLMHYFPRKKRIFRERRNYFDYYDDYDFLQRFRLPKICVRFITEKIADQISSRTQW